MAWQPAGAAVASRSRDLPTACLGRPTTAFHEQTRWAAASRYRSKFPLGFQRQRFGTSRRQRGSGPGHPCTRSRSTSATSLAPSLPSTRTSSARTSDAPTCNDCNVRAHRCGVAQKGGGHLGSPGGSSARKLTPRALTQKTKTPVDQGFSAETEGFEPSDPVRGLHLSRVKSALRSPAAPIAVLPRNHADLPPHQAIPVLRRVTLHALYALQERPESASSGCSGTLGGPLPRTEDQGGSTAGRLGPRARKLVWSRNASTLACAEPDGRPR